MSKGKNVTYKQVKQMNELNNAGVAKTEIARIVGLGYSTVCDYIAKGKKIPRSTVAKKTYSINCNKKNYDYVDEIATKMGITKCNAMTQIVKLAKRKCLFSWG